MDHSALSMPLGEAIFTQRSIRRFKPDPIPLDDIHLILEAAVEGAQRRQPAGRAVPRRERSRHDPRVRRALPRGVVGEASRRGVPASRRPPRRYHSAAGLADAMADVPCIVFALAMHNGPRQLRHPGRAEPDARGTRAGDRLRADDAASDRSWPASITMFGIPDDVGFHFCVPLGYPQGNFGPTTSQADVGDDLPRPMGRSRSVGVRSAVRQRALEPDGGYASRSMLCLAMTGAAPRPTSAMTAAFSRLNSSTSSWP